jgi:hypothetical protein
MASVTPPTTEDCHDILALMEQAAPHLSAAQLAILLAQVQAMQIAEYAQRRAPPGAKKPPPDTAAEPPLQG